jgi:hypothetical protein
MPSTATDRIDGISTSVAVKAPVRVATTANITLSGLQVIDGATLSAGGSGVNPDRVLVKDQTNSVYNGIYDVSATSWSRAKDFDGARDVVQGTLVPVYEGAVNGRTTWQCTTANPVRFGTSSLTFEMIVDVDLAADLANTTNPALGSAMVGFYDPVVTAPVFLKYVSDVINGERVSSLRWISTAAERAAIIAGTTLTDHGTVLNQMFQDMKQSKKGNLYLHPGLYNSSTKLTLTDNLSVFAHGATIKALTGLTASDPLMINENLDGSDTDINWYGGLFQGNAGARTAELVSLIRITRLKMSARVTGNQYIGLALAGCVGFDLDVEVDNYGKTAVTAEGGAGLWIGTYNSLHPCQHGEAKARVHDGEWAGIYVTGVVGHLNSDIKIYPQIYNVKEAGIFGGYFNGLQIIAPQIDTVVKKNISGSGIELGGIDFSILGGYITNTDASGIALTDCQGGNIGGGLLTRNVRRDSASFATGSHISIITTETLPDQPRWLTVEGHTAIDTSSPAYAAVEIGNSGDAILNTVIQNNNYSGTVFTSGDPIHIATGKWGAGCYRKNNAGSWDANGGTSGDRGDASITVDVGVDEETQLFETTLTANRAVTLNSTTAYEGARFRVVRTGLGAFTLSVGGLKTIPNSTAAFVDVVYTGSTWKLAGYGTL